MQRTRIKVCGLTRIEDVRAVAASGADAAGFVFYPHSPRHVTPAQAAPLVAALGPFVTATGLFVNATVEQVAQAVAAAPVGLLQFHGDESPAHCAARLSRQAGHPAGRFARIRTSVPHRQSPVCGPVARYVRGCLRRCRKGI